MLDYSVFIPVYNEQAILANNARRLLAYLDGLGRSYELIIGSNGSDDATREIGSALAMELPNLVFFHLPHKGPGRAFAHALTIYKGRALITLDMDLSVDLEFVPSALKLLAENQVVVGSKRQGLQERSLWRILGSGLFIAAARVLMNLPFEDYSLGAKAFARPMLTRFGAAVDAHTAYVTNLLFCARRAGLPMVELPVRCTDNRASRFNLGHEAAYRLAWALRLFWQGRVRRRFP